MKRTLIPLSTALLLVGGLVLAPPEAPPAGAAEGPTFYVAPDGDDSRDGAEGSPFRTVEAARDAIRDLRADGQDTAGATVYLREGAYPRSSSFELGEQDSGTAEAPIVYRSYPGETARLTGGVELDKDAFVPVSDEGVRARIIDESARDKVLQVDLADLGITDYGQISRHGYWRANDVSEVPPMELYVGGQAMTLARWPNEGTVQMGDIIDEGPTRHDPDLQERGGTFTYTYDRPQYWTEAEDVWLDGIFGSSWEWSYNRIENIDPEAKTITLAYGEMSGLMKTWFEDFHFAENLLEELDVAGEYYIDRDAGVLYYLPNAAFATTDAEVTVTMLDEPMIRTDGTSHVRFEELVLEYGRATAAVVLGGSNVTIAHSDIQNFADGGVLFNSPGRYTYDGIPVNRGGTDHALESSVLRHIGGVAVVVQGGDKKTLEPGRIRVENSRIHDFAYYHKAYNPGVMFDGVGNIARNNEIFDAPHPGVIVYGNDHLIEYNEIYDVCKTFQDLGAIYMNAGATPHERGTVISRNYFHDTGVGRLGVEGVYADNLTRGLTIDENVFYRMGNDAIKSGSGDYISAKNNVFVDTHIPYNNYEMWMGDEPGNTVDTAYMPGWIDLFEENNGFVGTPHAAKYPELLDFFDENHYYPEHNVFERNLTWNPTLARASDVNEHGARDVHDLMHYADNWVADDNPGFVDWENGDFRFTEDAAAFEQIPGFAPVAFEDIGTQGSIGQPSGPSETPLQSLHFPSAELSVPVGRTVPFRAEAVPWNADDTSVSYASSDASIATIDANGAVTALSPGETTVTATASADPAISVQALVTVIEGDGVLHFTDFESGGNGWPVDGNRAITADESGNHWYRIRNGANGQLDRSFGRYMAEFSVRTPEEIPEGAVLLFYDRSGDNPGGYIRYQHRAEGARWTVFDSAWGTVAEADVPEERELTPGSIAEVRIIVAEDAVRVAVDGEPAIESANPAPDASGRIGFYVEGFSHLDIDDVRISLAPATVTGIELSSTEVALQAGERHRLTATVTPADGGASALAWSSSDEAVATVGPDGTVRATGAGEAVVTATSTITPSVTATADVAVSEADHPLIDLAPALRDTEGWPAAVTADGEGVGFAAEGVYGYSGDTFADGLLRFRAEVGEFDGGWYGFAVRSDRPDAPAWVGANKGYLVVVKEDVIEIQSWKPAQTMVDVIPNDAVRAGGTHDIEFGAVAESGGTRVVLRVDDRAVWSWLDTDAANPIGATGHLNVYHYGKGNTLRLTPATASSPIELAATTRCAAGKAVLAVRTTNTGAAGLSVDIDSGFGVVSLGEVRPGGSVSRVFSTRGAEVAAGIVTATAESGIPVTATYEALSCG